MKFLQENLDAPVTIIATRTESGLLKAQGSWFTEEGLRRLLRSNERLKILEIEVNYAKQSNATKDDSKRVTTSKGTSHN
jgi:hypothetical protein